ncbi:GNAT family N-acetyltransferase [Cohnella cholangitidis]|uniref:GNAT family N-acetyltransferase n=1 Tax=Cohnella cholangitidis TaxID=2598458 RepID=A0A7G5C670_9BACL|nr:GNAT family N-acetyltransferase [Cohnella cholangitidis]QMV44704.1 GNAT family N-acetyltransferase [Cohnella cholangitidis]
MYHYRDATLADFQLIASFPQSKEELFYMYPKGTFPLTAEQLADAAYRRLSLTVAMDSDDIVGYSNLYNVAAGEDCWIGNVIIKPTSRGTGAASFLIQTMINRAAEEHQAKNVHLVCHNANSRALLFYHKLGFVPYEISPIEDSNQGKIAGIRMRIAVEGQVTL